MLEKLLESLDKEVYSAEMLEGIQMQFNEAVLAKAEELSNQKLEEALAEKDKEIEAKISELEEKSEQYINESIKEKTVELEEQSAEFVSKKLDEINESLDLFLEEVIKEFNAEAKAKLDESLKSTKADMIIESYEAMITAGAVDMMKIAESKDNSEAEKKLEESISKYDSLMIEHLELKKEKEQLIKNGIIMEMKEGLSLVEAKKFEKLAEMVSFSQDEKFVERLAVIKESVSGSKAEEEQITESVVAKEEIAKPIYSHLV